MKKNSKQNTFDLVLSCLLSGVVTFVMMFLLDRTEIPLDKSGRLILSLLFPVAMFLFNMISKFVSAPGCYRKASRFDQWAMLWIMPFFILGFSWRFFDSWQIVFSLFNWLYITTRMGLIFAFRQSSKHPRKINIEDFLIVFTGVTLLNIGRFASGSLKDIVFSILNAAILSLIAFLCAYLAESKSIDGFTGTIYQRLFIMQIAISIPLLSMSTHVTVYHLLSAGVLLFLIFIASDEKKVQYAGICLGAIIIVLTPIVFPEGVVLSLWICLILIERDRKKKLFEGILIPGGSVVLFMIGFLIAAIRYKGLFPQGNVIYHLLSVDVLLAPLIDQTYGLIPLLPWFVLVLSGWLIAYKHQNTGKLCWIAFPFVLYGLTMTPLNFVEIIDKISVTQMSISSRMVNVGIVKNHGTWILRHHRIDKLMITAVRDLINIKIIGCFTFLNFIISSGKP